MIPLFKPNVSPDRATKAVEEVLRSGYLTQGPKVDEFELAIQKELKLMRRPTLVNSATSALEIVWDILEIGPGDEVISTPMTCFATNVGLVRRGATIVWADVNPFTGLIDPSSVALRMTNKTKAIVAVDWAGQIAPFEALNKLGVPTVEDAAHVWDVNGLRRQRGDFRVYSFQAIKFLTAGDGGALICPDDETTRKARLLRWYGLDRDNAQDFRSGQDIVVAGTKFNMNDISAAIGLSNMVSARFGEIYHRENARRLYIDLQNSPNVITVPWDRDTNYWMFPLVMAAKKDRDSFVQHLASEGVQANRVHTRNDKYTAMRKFDRWGLPGVTFFDDYQINIPCGWWLSEEDLQHIVKAVNSYDG